MKLLVTGGAGFIGANFIHYWLKNHPDDEIVNYDLLTYAGNLENLKAVESNPKYKFVKGDITDAKAVEVVMAGVDVVVHFAAESHVDRSIMGSGVFVMTNVVGTHVLLDAALKHKVKRFHHISTDEVFGSLELGTQEKFSETTAFAPNSPYSASKAGSDHLVRAYFETYQLPITISNCANNYGPYHDPEKLIPRFITNLLEGKKVPLMGKGENIREWLHAEDHAEAIDFILRKGKVGETYLIEGEEKSNIEISRMILKILGRDESMIDFVGHRLGHDFRYAINGEKLKKLGWQRKHNLEEDLPKVIKWFKDNEWWWKPLKEGRPSVDRVFQKAYNG